ncbi:MAG: glycoside hydrolase family 1 protein [Acidobacteria bacterium]|nr:glycoside hydrolase family 1 protein [Acidobacteriota bacterium]MBI3656505.1 glycoside hydrolase family 1 protein [Acidobacteriota bacterium]
MKVLGRLLVLLTGGMALIVSVMVLRFYKSIPDIAAVQAHNAESISLLQRDLKEGLAFPKEFFWGSATSAHQVEGNNTNNDWYVWEQARDKNGRCRVRNCDASGAAAEHYQRFDADFALARNLNQNMHRFSIEWSRIEPKEGEWDFNAVNHYREVLASLKRHGIRPMVTLHHFTNPLWLAQSGGWKNPKTIYKFERYVRFVVEQFRSDVDVWVTINEPEVYAVYAYLYGIFPPGEKDLTAMLVVMSNLLKGHARAYRAIHELYNVGADGDRRPALVGLVKHMRIFMPDDPGSSADRSAAKIYNYFFNVLALDSVATGRIQFNVPLVYARDEIVEGLKDSWDFIGVNYFSRDMVAFDFSRPYTLFARITYRPDRRRYSEIGEGWEIFPQGLFQSLMTLKRYDRPIFITENGIADAGGALRPSFIGEHAYNVWQAIQRGVDVRGYLYWALIDNFEWNMGSSPRFGLYTVDYQTQERRLTAGGELLRDLAAANALTPAIQARLRSGY